jgi:hypothetical protein
MFVALDEWQTLMHADFTKLNDDEKYTLEAFTHEFTHVLQLSTMGYGYDLSYRIFMSVEAAARAHGTLDELLVHRSDYSNEIRGAFQTLYRKGEHGISPLVILESAAFHAQKLSHYEQLGPHDYERMLDAEVPTGEYRLAYDVAAEWLGANALDQFPHIANLSLAVKRPELAFPVLLEAFKAGASRTDVEANHKLGLAVLNERFADIMLGSATDLLFTGMAHPMLLRIVRTYNELANEGRLHPITLMARGRVSSRALVNALLGPVLFPPTPSTGDSGPVWIPEHWKQAAASDPLLLDVSAIRFLSACSQLLQQDVESPEPSPLTPPSRSPVADVYNIPVAIRNIEVRRENRTVETAAHFATLFQKLEADPRKIRALQGTVLITFPDEEFADDESPLADSAVQAFLQQLFEKIPHLFYFLADTPPLSAVLLAVAAFAPEALQFSGDQANVLTTAEALGAIVTAEHYAAQFAINHGHAPAVVFGHLRAFDSKTQVKIEQLAMALQ